MAAELRVMWSYDKHMQAKHTEISLRQEVEQRGTERIVVRVTSKDVLMGELCVLQLRAASRRAMSLRRRDRGMVGGTIRR